MRRAEATLPRDCRPWRGGTNGENPDGHGETERRRWGEEKREIEAETERERQRGEQR